MVPVRWRSEHNGSARGFGVFESTSGEPSLGVAHGIQSFGSLAPPKRVGRLALLGPVERDLAEMGAAA